MSQADFSLFRISVNADIIEHRGFDGDQLLAVLLDQGLVATKLGCGTGHCGACTVWLNRTPARACDTSIGSISTAPGVDPKKVITLEGLSREDSHLSACLTQAFLTEQAAQCGYCSSGILMKAAALILEHTGTVKKADMNAKGLSEGDVAAALDDHLCRCGSHRRVVRAVIAAQKCYSIQNKNHGGIEPSLHSLPRT